MIFEGIKKILVIKLRHIGDVLLTVPVFRALRETFPDARIYALVNSGTEEVLSGNPLIDKILVFNRTIKKMKPFQKYLMELSFLRKIRKEDFDLTIDLTSGDRAAIESFISGAKYRIAYKPGKGFWGKRHLYTHLAKNIKGQHTVFKNLNAVRQFGINTDNLTVDFFIPEDARIFVKKIFYENEISANDRIIHVHPTSRWFFKCWKDEYFAEVIRWIVSKGIKVVITSSPASKEIEKANRILSLLYPAKTVNLCGKTSIKQLAAVSEASDLFLGVDTAPMHIAAAVGTRVIALFGAGEKIWRPWGDGHVVISKERSFRSDLKGEEYARYVIKNLLQIKPEDVIGEIERMLLADWTSL